MCLMTAMSILWIYGNYGSRLEATACPVPLKGFSFFPDWGMDSIFVALSWFLQASSVVCH